ncbi:unnamed protein product [Schistosoma curassoni]|uniref:Transmembrane protein n=1 Tax=Schistosoma curassoni TaxID=6186 RepID=A0A183JEX5_9TREM|nr:unnamed protein product [Schistosoma curassoni]
MLLETETHDVIVILDKDDDDDGKEKEDDSGTVVIVVVYPLIGKAELLISCLDCVKFNILVILFIISSLLQSTIIPSTNPISCAVCLLYFFAVVNV